MTDEKFVLAYNTEAEELERMLRESSRDIRYCVARIFSLAKYSEVELSFFRVLAEFGPGPLAPAREFEVRRSDFNDCKDLAVKNTRQIIEARHVIRRVLGGRSILFSPQSKNGLGDKDCSINATCTTYDP